MKSFKKGLGGVLAVFIGAVISFNITVAQELTQGYNSDESLRRGMIVGLTDVNDTVASIGADQINTLHGVVVDASDAPFLLADETSDVYVATNGRFEVLVSDANGPVKSGDFLSVSSVAGIAQKASDKQNLVLGKALQDYVPAAGSISLSTAQDADGSEYNIGRILVDVAISANPNLAEEDQSAPDFLRRASEIVADKPVSPIRQYISLAILILVSGIAGSLTYASVRSSITAIGRNPLSRKSITKSLIQVVIISFLILLSGFFTVYLILRL